MMKRIIATILCALSIFALCACDSSLKLDKISGTEWELTGMSYGGIDLSETEMSGHKGSLSFTDETQVVLALSGDERSGTYVTQGDDTLSITISGVAVDTAFSSERITLTMNGVVMTFTQKVD